MPHRTVSFPVPTVIRLLALALALAFTWAAHARADAPVNPAQMTAWIQQMKVNPRGPFDGIFWFCKDGSILPPTPYACAPFGGGIQHGRWSERTRQLRDAGYLVGNVLAATDPQALAADPARRELKATLLERYLVAADDGWVLRQARYYRGAFQIENETAAAEAILAALAARLETPRDDLLLRQAALLLPLLRDGATVTRAHELSSSLATLDAGFVPLRNKIHSQPDAGDAARVRAYARKQGRTEAEYEALAQVLDELFAPRDLSTPLRAFADRLGRHPLGRTVADYAAARAAARSDAQRFAAASAFLAQLRDGMGEWSPAVRVQAVKLGLDIEAEVFAAGLRLQAAMPTTLAERLALLGSAGEALYGVGLLTPRERASVQEALGRLTAERVRLDIWREELGYLARVPGWAGRELDFHFGEAVQTLARIEPLASAFGPDRLRASPLLVYSALLDALLLDAHARAGLEHELFGRAVGAGLRALNPGLARGVLRLDATHPQPDGIYLLPETTEHLPPVAGILTLEAGNLVSHVQLLAANLGIPNVVVDRSLLPRLRAMAGRKIVLAVSPGGRVLLAEDGPRWDAVFGVAERAPARVSAGLDKLDLTRRAPIPLGQLRADDGGRVAGPKAAKLGELKYHYPEAVADGVVLPFGAFRALLDQPMPGTGLSAYAWMRAEYRRIAGLPAAQRAPAAARLRERLRSWIESTDPGEAFRASLAQAIRDSFGPDERVAVFVRSDTNMEDLPGFTGAGLNLTVPNAVGLEQVVTAIRRVWASPFTERAFAWRQLRMDAPEHVYVSVLLQRSVPVEKSGVMVTMDLVNGRTDTYTVAANMGIGGAVAGQAAEELLIAAEGKGVRLLSEASAATQRVLGEGGGLETRPVSGGPVLSDDEIEQLRQLGRALQARLPQRDEGGDVVPADVEFGFVGGRLALFQVRPYLQSQAARRDRFLIELDAPLRAQSGHLVRPWEEN